jgi:hypothetical protein
MEVDMNSNQLTDAAGGKFYWTQKGPDNAGQGRIFRANIELPSGQSTAKIRGVQLAVPYGACPQT